MDLEEWIGKDDHSMKIKLRMDFHWVFKPGKDTNVIAWFQIWKKCRLYSKSGNNCRVKIFFLYQSLGEELHSSHLVTRMSFSTVSVYSKRHVTAIIAMRTRESRLFSAGVTKMLKKSLFLTKTMKAVQAFESPGTIAMLQVLSFRYIATILSISITLELQY